MNKGAFDVFESGKVVSSRGVDESPGETRTHRQVGIDVHRSIRPHGERKAVGRIVPKRWTRPRCQRRDDHFDVINKPVIAAGPATRGLLDAEL